MKCPDILPFPEPSPARVEELADALLCTSEDYDTPIEAYQDAELLSNFTTAVVFGFIRTTGIVTGNGIVFNFDGESLNDSK